MVSYLDIETTVTQEASEIHVISAEILDLTIDIRKLPHRTGLSMIRRLMNVLPGFRGQ